MTPVLFMAHFPVGGGRMRWRASAQALWQSGSSGAAFGPSALQRMSRPSSVLESSA
ncbi:MAG TPA: hypothetical protein VF957_17280 [Bradyrhizobium sp.]